MPMPMPSDSASRGPGSRVHKKYAGRRWCHVRRRLDSREQQGSSSEQELPLPHLAARTEEAARTTDPTGRRSDGSMFGYVGSGWRLAMCVFWCTRAEGRVDSGARRGVDGYCYGTTAAGAGVTAFLVSQVWEGTLLQAQATAHPVPGLRARIRAGRAMGAAAVRTETEGRRTKYERRLGRWL